MADGSQGSLVKIESGIPIPTSRIGTVIEPALINSMAVGDSILITPDIRTKRCAYAMVGNYNKKFKPKRFVARSVEGGIRFWRFA